MGSDYSKLKPTLLECIVPLWGQSRYYSRTDEMKESEQFNFEDPSIQERFQKGSSLVSLANLAGIFTVNYGLLEGLSKFYGQ